MDMRLRAKYGTIFQGCANSPLTGRSILCVAICVQQVTAHKFHP